MNFSESLNFILHESGQIFGVTSSQILSDSKYPEVCKARFVSMMLCYIIMNMSASHIARVFNRHHATVIYAIERVKTHEELRLASEKIEHVYNLLKD